jgi:hypothetical protein
MKVHHIALDIRKDFRVQDAVADDRLPRRDRAARIWAA